jgi:hypothetical protein
VDTASGRLDARVETQLAVLEQAAFPLPATDPAASTAEAPGQMTAIPRSR